MGRCLLSGNYCSTERSRPSKCKEDFSGWQLRPEPSRKPSYPKCLLYLSILIIAVAGCFFECGLQEVGGSLAFASMITLCASALTAMSKEL